MNHLSQYAPRLITMKVETDQIGIDNWSRRKNYSGNAKTIWC